jgi:raffinose/stachyose/melibiose transport system substrate-binding protein
VAVSTEVAVSRLPPLRRSRRAVLGVGAAAALAGCGLPPGLLGPAPTPSPAPPSPVPTPTRPPVIATPAPAAALAPAARAALAQASASLGATKRTVPPAAITVVDHDARPNDLLAWAAVRAAFSAAYPNVAIEHERLDREEAATALLARQERGELPSLGRLASPDELAAAGLLIPLDEVISVEEQRRIDARVGPYRWDALFATGPDRIRRLYGLPYASATQGVLFNRAIFEQEGINPAEIGAWNWDDLTRLCQQLTRPDRPALALAGHNSLATARLLHLIVRAFGGGLVRGRYVDSLAPARLAINTPETIAGISAFVALYRKGWLQPTAPSDGERQSHALFAAGRAALLPATTWELATLRDALAARSVAIGSLSLPRGPNNLHTTVETAVAGLFVGARAANRLLASVELLTFLASDAGTRLFTLVSGALPASEAVAKEAPWASEPLYQGFRESLLFADWPAPRWMLTVPETVLARVVAGLIPGLLTTRVLPEEAARQWELALIDALDRLGVRVPR